MVDGSDREAEPGTKTLCHSNEISRQVQSLFDPFIFGTYEACQQVLDSMDVDNGEEEETISLGSDDDDWSHFTSLLYNANARIKSDLSSGQKVNVNPPALLDVDPVVHEDKKTIFFGSGGSNSSHLTRHDTLLEHDKTRVQVKSILGETTLSLPAFGRPALASLSSNTWSMLSRFQPYTESFPAFHFDKGELNWGEELLQLGHLFFPDHDSEEGKIVELRIRSAVAAHPGWSLEDVLAFAVAHCLPFRIMTPVSLTPASYTTEASVLDIEHENPLEVVRRWKAGLACLFQCRHSRALVFIGGIETRLALMVGGLDFMRSAMHSADLTGPQCIEEMDGQVYTDDAVSADEVNLLLGCVVPTLGNGRKVVRSLWPSSAQLKLKFPEHFTGDWNTPCENLFQAIWLEVNGPNPKLRNVTQWRTFFKHGGRTNSASPSLDHSAWREAHEALIMTAKDEWHGKRISGLLAQDTIHSASPRATYTKIDQV